ncbi:endonuclease/exonuclease/phosphatase family metal-dependent hydrolase [Rhodovulum imhoffii]|uniref:Endonuclease/exonuclease/phosphatase family metal-dependent hydrolase n=1 Tax=Rhodovulum imhoffii TaxID=365340 RepID=A0A2T5BP62_9RHOB|nr:endonuclease/exonuclease/phosphatase family protein [Rhodovulum imhoffii]MBK5933755.1 endonuclease [Rhodovulum imhoffii]PTN00776.1 endonuclease/exonuclease/phosphatase family metal-dependent hydrolase [Rhodovulum imhoffii]
MRVLAILLIFCAGVAVAQPLRVGVYHTGLSRNGPGVMLRDIQKGDPQVQAVVEVINAAAPDILLLLDFDYDAANAALTALAGRLRKVGADFPHLFALRPNTGLRTGLDMDGDGRSGGPGDAQGWGTFAGQGGMALLSRWPIAGENVRDFSDLLWRDLPGAILPATDEAPFPSAEAQAAQRLSSTAHWDIPVMVKGRPFHILAFHATPPVFDGPEDRNGLRNRDELRFWQIYLESPDAPARFVLLGGANLDPHDGDGHSMAMRAFLDSGLVQEPAPRDSEGNLHTAFWPRTASLRVDYALPAPGLTVHGTGVFSGFGPLAETVAHASSHRLVWVDLALP